MCRPRSMVDRNLRTQMAHVTLLLASFGLRFSFTSSSRTSIAPFAIFCQSALCKLPRCSKQALRSLNEWSHKWHLNGPLRWRGSQYCRCCSLMCRCMLPLLANGTLQYLQVNGRSPVWVPTCRFNAEHDDRTFWEEKYDKKIIFSFNGLVPEVFQRITKMRMTDLPYGKFYSVRPTKLHKSNMDVDLHFDCSAMSIRGWWACHSANSPFLVEMIVVVLVGQPPVISVHAACDFGTQTIADANWRYKRWSIFE